MGLPFPARENIFHPIVLAVKQQSQTSPWRARFVWVMLGLTAFLTVLSWPFMTANYDWLVKYHHIPVSGMTMLLSDDGVSILGCIGLSLLGALIIFARPENRIGWLFLVGAFFSMITQLAGHYALYAYMTAPDSHLPLRALAFWLQNWIWLPATYFPYSIVLPLMFPNGHLPSKRWRWLLRWAILIVGLQAFLMAFHPNAYLENYFVDIRTDLTNPYGLALIGRLFPREIIPILSILYLATVLGAAFSLVVRYKDADYDTRQQIKWFGFGLVVALALFVARHLDGDPWIYRPNLLGLIKIASTISAIGLPILFGVSIFKYRLYDIDIIINRTLVYGVLTVVIVALYILIVWLLGRVFEERDDLFSSLVATGLVAVSFQDLRERLQGGVNRLMFGQRDEPYHILSRLGQQLNTVRVTENLLPTIVETVTTALKLPYAAITIRQHQQDVMRASWGEAQTPTQVIPLVYQNERVGQLVIGQRSPGEPLTPADQRILEDIARQMGTVVHGIRLAEDLQRAREQLVTAREEERRRLRRDLHDGLGPTLASHSLKLDAAIDLVETSPQTAIRLLSEVKTQSQMLVAEIRRLVYDLRPPALDELGLLEALRSHISQLVPAQGDLTITIETYGELPPLSAAVEVAVYRTVQEAVLNVVRHAGAKFCILRLSVLSEESHLQIDVIDDGCGLPQPVTSGVGLQSMRERAEELGGMYVARNRSSGGAHIQVRLPFMPVEVAP